MRGASGLPELIIMVSLFTLGGSFIKERPLLAPQPRMVTVPSEGEPSDKSKLTTYSVGLFGKPDKPIVVNQSPRSASK